MRAVTSMYGSLNRRFLPPYGAEGVIVPNFQRLARHCVTFVQQSDAPEEQYQRMGFAPE